MRLPMPPAARPRAGVVLLLLAAAACHTSTGAGSTVGTRVRAIQASADAPLVDIVIRDTARFTALPFDSVTSYIDAPADSDTVVIRNAADQTVLASTPQIMLAGGIYTLAVFNPFVDSLKDIVILDDTTAPATGFAKLRGINLSPSVNVVDVYLSPPGTTIDEQSPVMTNLQYPNVSAYVPVLAGTYEIRLTLPATKTVVLDAGEYTFADGQNRSLVVLDAKGGGTPISSTMLEDRN